MTTLTIYTDKFDSEENVVNGGMSGKAFLDIEPDYGVPFSSLDDAMKYIQEHNTQLEGIDIYYLNPETKEQMHRWFMVK